MAPAPWLHNWSDETVTSTHITLSSLQTTSWGKIKMCLFKRKGKKTPIFIFSWRKQKNWEIWFKICSDLFSLGNLPWYPQGRYECLFSRDPVGILTLSHHWPTGLSSASCSPRLGLFPLYTAHTVPDLQKEHIKWPHDEWIECLSIGILKMMVLIVFGKPLYNIWKIFLSII